MTMLVKLPGAVETHFLAQKWLLHEAVSIDEMNLAEQTEEHSSSPGYGGKCDWRELSVG